jgi:signal transduction histidine kinase
MRRLSLSQLQFPAFIALYLLFDWATYIDPLYGLNITPWNPDPALGLVFWLRHGRRAALPWFLALLGGELLVRGMPAGWAVTVLGSLWLTVGYGLIGEALRRNFSSGDIFDNRVRLFQWVAIITCGTLLNDVVYIGLLSLAGLIPPAGWGLAVLRFGVGDMVGMLVSMPLIWMLASAQGRSRLRQAVWRPETLGYVSLLVFVLSTVFGSIASSEFKHFYFLFLPVIWAASRQGLCGTALIVFALQTGIVALVKWSHAAHITVVELQLLDAVLALVGFFIGIVVDELRKVASELKQTLRLAAAGEMAAALAHELNQPLTALSAYGKACELLLERQGSDEGSAMLKNAIQRMVIESGRAAEVVRRLRDFFRTGAMKLEPVDVRQLVSGMTQQFFSAFREHGVTLEVGELPALAVQADRLQIELVLRNLLANALEAVQASPGGARRVTVTADRIEGSRLSAALGAAGAGGARLPRRRAAAPRLRLTVEDSGQGVSEALAARLFEPFVSSKASGLGLGLVLSRAIVEAHGGTLWAEVAGHGIFRLVLPLAGGEELEAVEADQVEQRVSVGDHLAS